MKKRKMEEILNNIPKSDLNEILEAQKRVMQRYDTKIILNSCGVDYIESV